jgi:hypothetical protein
MELCKKFPTKVGISLKETIRRRQASSQKNTNGSTAADDNHDISKDGTHDTPAPFNGLIRMTGAPVPINPRSTREKMKEDEMPEAYDPDIDPSNSSKPDIKRIIELKGLNVYKDQTGLTFTNWQNYPIKAVNHPTVLGTVSIFSVHKLQCFPLQSFASQSGSTAQENRDPNPWLHIILKKSPATQLV